MTAATAAAAGAKHTPPSQTLRDLRALAADIATAEDAALLRLVRMLDNLPARGEADRVLERARPRLRHLRPARPLRFARLMFTPLDGAIQPAAAWKRGGHEVPRTALAPLAAAVDTALGPLAAEIRREAEGRTMADAEAVTRIGARLWPAAADALPQSPPPGWAEAGLGAEDHAAIRAIVAPVLAAGGAIVAALHAAAQGPPPALLRAALAGPAEAGPQPLAAAMATLMTMAASPSAVLAVAAEFGGPARVAANRLLDTALEQPLEIVADSPALAAAGAARFFAWTEDLARAGTLDPDRNRRLLALQREAVETCRRRILDMGSEELVAPVMALRQPGAAPPDDAALAAMEAEARGIQALAQAARGVGDPSGIDRAMRGLGEQLAAQRGQSGGLSPVELARLVEILAGPEAAVAVLRGGAPG